MNKTPEITPLTPVRPSLVTAYGPACLLFAAILGGGFYLQNSLSLAEQSGLLRTAITLLAFTTAVALVQWQRSTRLRALVDGQASLLQENEALFLSTLDNATAGLALISKDGKWLKMNHAVTRIVGYPEHELMTLDFQTLTHPDDLDADLHFVKQVIERKIDSYTMEKRYIRKDGSIIWIQLSVSAAWDATGNLRHFISRIEDINERKLLQERLRESEARGRRTS